MIITVDVGATKTLVAAFDQHGKVGEEYRFPTPHDEKIFLQDLLGTIEKSLKTKTKLSALSVALPGMITSQGILRIAPNLGWKDFDIQSQLAQRFKCPIFIGNDGRLAGLAEARALSKTPPLCLYLTIGTGIGAGLILKGKLYDELSNTEMGHMLLDYEGALTEWEAFASGRAIRETYHQYAYEITSQTIWREIADKISRGLLVLVPSLQPDTIIIGGSIGTHFHHYQIELEAILHRHLDPLSIPVPHIVQAAHPEEAVIYGCYEYARTKLAT